jgi:DNA anti-recombination protein RmuC
MADLSKLENALDRFEAALRRIEVAMVRRQERDQKAKLVAGEADALRHDRSRLAQELDDVRSKASELIGTNKQAVNKIDAAMSRIRAVLHSNSGGG